MTVQPNTHSFIIKVWLDEPNAANGRICWRGRITHVPSGNVHHFVHVNDIADFIMPYVQQLGVSPPRWWHARHWAVCRWVSHWWGR